MERRRDSRSWNCLGGRRRHADRGSVLLGTGALMTMALVLFGTILFAALIAAAVILIALWRD